MNINELESYKLSDAIKFRTELNPMLFNDERMASDVREKLLEIANEFIDYLGINNLDIDDITLSGSNAAYTYTDHSDIDLHILVDMNKINNDDIYRELFTAKKNLFNADHDIKIRGYDVELYVQDKNQPVKSLGEYSILNDKWIKFPRKQRASIDQNSVKHKVTKLVQMAEIANRSNNIDQIDKVLSTIKRYRQSGLDKHGEFGPENIAFKILRTNGIIDKLYNHRNKLYSIQLSLDEESQQNVTEVFDQPYKSIWTKSDTGTYYSRVKLPDGTPLVIVFIDMGHNKYTVGFSRSQSMGVTGEGDAQRIFSTVLNSVLQFVKKQKPQRLEFSASKEIDADSVPDVKSNLNSRSKLYTRMVKRYAESLGYNVQYQEEKDYVEYVLTQIQPEVTEGSMKDVYGEIQDEHWDGIVGYVINGLKKGISEERIELYLYKWAGKELFDLDEELEGRGFGSLSELVDHIQEHDGKYVNPTFDLDGLFGDDQENLSEASGYIPSESEKNDPRFKTALTVDIHPDTMKKNAAKFGWKIARNGRPPLLMKEDIVDEWSQTDPGIRKALEEKGYKFLDNGVDQSAYIEPGTGWILKIFGTQHNSKFEGTPTFSKDHKMFFKWAKFCMKNSDNPFLPRFGGYESFEWKGKTYLQIRQEQLKSVNNNVGELLEALADIVSSYGNNFTWDRFCMKFDDDLKDEKYQYSRRLVKLLDGDLQKSKLFYETLKSLHDISEKQRSYIWDMHKGNFMMRGKTPVIVDPWVVRKN